MMLNEHTKSHLCPPHTSQGLQDIHPDLPAAVLKPACQALDHLQAFLKNSQNPTSDLELESCLCASFGCTPGLEGH